jgi:hypothetical protein
MMNFGDGDAFEFGGWPVTQRRAQMVLVVDLLDAKLRPSAWAPARTEAPRQDPPLFAELALGSYRPFTSSTRRFIARPSSVSLGAIGLSGPYPLELSRPLSIPPAATAAITEAARSCDSFTL